MTTNQKAKKWVKNNTRQFLKDNEGKQVYINITEKEELAFIAGYEQAEYDAWFKYSRLAFKELDSFSKRYDLQDLDKK